MIYNHYEVGKMGMNMEQSNGVYIMRVASKLTEMHPQTLRKYERAGLLEPSRSKKLRMYSDEDIARLKIIKHLVDDVGLNIAGVKVVLGIQDTLKDIKAHLVSETSNRKYRDRLLKRLDESLSFVNTAPEGKFKPGKIELLVSNSN
jgi:MerR family transcriptional regulator, heat shock protein HspR